MNALSCLQPTLQTLHSIQMLHIDTPQGIANTLAYLQHYLHKVSKRQNNLETNINNALSTLTVQLQQLIQLVSNSLQSLTLVITSSLLPVAVSLYQPSLGLKPSQNLCPSQTSMKIEPRLCIPQLLHLIHLLGPRAVQL